MANGNGLVDDLLDTLLGLSIDDAERNARPMDPVLEQVKQPVTVASGAVSVAAHRQNGLHLLLGEGATPAGAAAAFIRLCRPQPGDWNGDLKPSQYEALGMELFRFATEVVFGTPQEPTSANLATYWLTGTLLAVPALLDTSGAAPRLTVDRDRLEPITRNATHLPLARVAVGSLHALNPYARTIPYYHQVDHKRVASALPDPATVAADRAAVLTDFAAGPATATATWRQRLRWNPYAAALPIVHLLASTSDNQRPDFVNGLLDPAELTAHELDRIGRTSAGVVVLRVVLLTTAGLGSTADARNRAAGALGVAAADDLHARDVPAPAIEPPAPAIANLTAKRVNRLSFARAFLGRPVTMTWTSYTQDSGSQWQGPSAAGSIYPTQYFTDPANADRDSLKDVGDASGTPLSDDQLGDRLAAIAAIFDIEGYADAIRAADRALVSVGMQQFSCHVEEEATILLRRMRGLSDAWFDVFFRSAGIEVGGAPLDSTGKTVNIEALQQSKVTTQVPQIARPVASSAAVTDLDAAAWLIRLAADGRNRWCVPGTVGLRNGKPALPTVANESGQQHLDCHDALGFQQHTAGSYTEVVLARWAVAARLVPEVIRAQMEMCVHRFNRLVHKAQETVTAKVDSKHSESHSRWTWVFADAADSAVTMQALFSSTAHAAALIDCFINTPNATIGAARRAYDRAVAGWTAELGGVPVDVADPRFRVRLLLAYLSERRYYTASLAGFATDRWYRRAGTNNVAADRIARFLDRIEEKTPVRGLGPRSITWTQTFHW
jgi:hypothetical protein